MSQSLSIILPVRDAEAKLARCVAELLDVCADLSPSVELLIVDDGSTDDTAEVAEELSRRYPQVSVLHQRRQGVMAALKAGMASISGDVVLIHDVESPPSGRGIGRLWAMRDESDLIFVRPESGHATSRGDSPRRARLTAWSGTQMLRRQAVDEISNAEPPDLRRQRRIDKAEAATVPRTPNLNGQVLASQPASIADP